MPVKIEQTFAPEINQLAESNQLSYSQTVDKLTRMYDGYRFCMMETDKLFNPFSVLKVLEGRIFDNH